MKWSRVKKVKCNKFNVNINSISIAAILYIIKLDLIGTILVFYNNTILEKITFIDNSLYDAALDNINTQYHKALYLLATI